MIAFHTNGPLMYLWLKRKKIWIWFNNFFACQQMSKYFSWGPLSRTWQVPNLNTKHVRLRIKLFFFIKKRAATSIVLYVLVHGPEYVYTSCKRVDWKRMLFLQPSVSQSFSMKILEVKIHDFISTVIIMMITHGIMNFGTGCRQKNSLVIIIITPFHLSW